MKKTVVMRRLRMKRVAGGVLMSGAVLLLISACAPVGKMTHDMDTMIQRATTKADHEALATHYEQEAKALQAKAADHRSMGQAYAKRDGYVVTKTNLALHCNALASSYEKAAGREPGISEAASSACRGSAEVAHHERARTMVAGIHKRGEK